MNTFNNNFYKSFPALHFVLILLFLFQLNLFAQSEMTPGKLDSAIVSYQNHYRVAGIATMIIKDNKIIWSKNYGYRDLQNQLPVEDSTFFLMASISKTIVATAVMQLWEKGMIDLNKDVNNYLPSDVTVVNPNFPDDSITVKMLMTHTSTLADNAPSIGCGATPVTLENFLKNGLIYTNVKPGTQWRYASLNADLLALIVQNLAGEPFYKYCRDSIFTPLSMNSTSWFFTGMDTDMVAIPYEGNTPYCNYGTADYPSDDLRTNKLELANFLMAYMNNGTYNNYRLLDSSTIAYMLRDWLGYKVQPLYYPQTQGLIWNAFDFTGGISPWGHVGGNIGCLTYMGYDPAEKWGVIWFENWGNGTAAYTPFAKILATFVNYAHSYTSPAIDTGQVKNILPLVYGNNPEGIITDKDGNVYVGNRYYVNDNRLAEIVRIRPGGSHNVFAKLPSTAVPGAEGLLGLAIDNDGNLYAGLASFDSTSQGVYKINMSDSSSEKLAGSEHIFFPNGLIFDSDGNLYVTDSFSGEIWKYGNDKEFKMWTADTLLAPLSDDPYGSPLPGANGIAFSPPNNLYVANTERASIVKIPIEDDGSAGTPLLVTQNLMIASIDGIVTDNHGEIYGLVPGYRVIGAYPLVKIDPMTGDITPVVTDTLQTAKFDVPTSLAFDKGGKDNSKLFVANADLAISPGGPGPGVVIVEIDTTMITGVEENISQPTAFKLEQNYPNPFNPSTEIRYSIGNREFVTLKIFNMLGQEIEALVNEEKPAGSYEIKLDAGNLSSGIYFYQLEAGSYVQTKKMVLLK